MGETGNLTKAAPEINTGGTQGLQSDRQLWEGGKGGRRDLMKLHLHS